MPKIIYKSELLQVIPPRQASFKNALQNVYNTVTFSCSAITAVLSELMTPAHVDKCRIIPGQVAGSKGINNDKAPRVLTRHVWNGQHPPDARAQRASY